MGPPFDPVILFAIILTGIGLFSVGAGFIVYVLFAAVTKVRPNWKAILLMALILIVTFTPSSFVPTGRVDGERIYDLSFTNYIEGAELFYGFPFTYWSQFVPYNASLSSFFQNILFVNCAYDLIVWIIVSEAVVFAGIVALKTSRRKPPQPMPKETGISSDPNDRS